jgi:hypothetical protein
VQVLEYSLKQGKRKRELISELRKHQGYKGG